MKTTLWTDPIVDEIHRIREELAKESGYDINVMVERLQEEERKHPEKMAKLEATPLKG